MTTIPEIIGGKAIATGAGAVGIKIEATAIVRQASARGDAHDVQVVAGGYLYANDIDYRTIDVAIGATCEPLAGDRAVVDALAYPTRHANDIGVGIHWTESQIRTIASVWYNVINYGADGSLANDDAAVAEAVAAMPASGGVLYFPTVFAGMTWPLSPTTFNKPVVVVGDGGADAYNSNAHAPTVITCSSATGTLFNFNSQGCAIRDVVLLNTSGSTPSAGAALSASGDNFSMERVKAQGFYDDVILTGAYFNIHACYILGPRRYGIVADNTAFGGDFGDWSISDTVVGTLDYNATAGLHYSAGGGGKIVNCKFNGWLGGYGFVNSIEAAIGSGIQTSVLLISNCSIENFRGDGIHVATSGTSPFFGLITIVGCEFGQYVCANDGGHGINIAAANLGEIEQVVIDDCSFRAATGGGVSMGEAISLTKIDNVAIGGAYTINANWTGFLAQSGCTNVRQASSGTVTSVSTGTGLTGGPITTTGTISMANTAVAPGSYTNLNATIDQQGRITAASNGSMVVNESELLMQDGVSAPPVPLENEDRTDWLYEG